METLCSATASELAQAIRERRVSSQEVVEASLRRIDAVDSLLNAVVQRTNEAARREAREADAALVRGEVRGPLHGVPFTVKDWLETKGVVCAAGVEERADFVPARDATAVARLRAAGAILLGKTNVLPENPVYGRTRNPYDRSRTPGGSSSGEAAVIAAGGSPLGLGSDSGGSIRLPAAYCGVAGLKPSTGRVPSTGHFPRIGALHDPRTQIGPMARSVRDLTLTLPILSGMDWRDAGVIPMPLGDPQGVDVAGLRIAFYTVFEGASPAPEVVAVTEEVVRVLAEAGAFVAPDRPARIEEALPITRLYWRRPESVSWSEWRPGRGSELTADEVERSLFEWDRLRRAMLGFMERYDAIVSPAAADAAGPHRALQEDDFVYTLPYSLTGWPCVVVRAGTSAEGLPLGVQVVGGPWRDDVALAVAQHIETALGGWQPPPL